MHTKFLMVFLAMLAALTVFAAAAPAAWAQDDDPAQNPLLFLPLLGAENSTVDKAAVKLPPVPTDQILTGPAPDLLPGWVLIEGDIQVPAAELERRIQIWEAGGSEFEAEGTYETNLWTNGIVPFEFDANVNAANQTNTTNAMQRWEAVSSVDFQQCASNNCTGDHLHIQSSTGNNSAVGRTGGQQIVNIVNWGNNFIIAHELGHALGLRHEQSRTNRNTFVTINSGNICKAGDAACNGGFCFGNDGVTRIDCDFNFAIATTSRTYGPYDFDSVMHYNRTAFSRNGNDTITVLAPNNAFWQTRIGQRDHVSVRDKNVMGCMYARPSWRWARTSAPVLNNGSCRRPFNGLALGVSVTPAGGTLWLEPGVYLAPGTYNKSMVWTAPNGAVTIGQ